MPAQDYAVIYYQAKEIKVDTGYVCERFKSYERDQALALAKRHNGRVVTLPVLPANLTPEQEKQLSSYLDDQARILKSELRHHADADADAAAAKDRTNKGRFKPNRHKR